ncbi:ArsR family transcriptional regulator [Klebsiella pneumoniae]|nr:ArsR family transcriptional regulator [Klebsiella pneumoniae]
MKNIIIDIVLAQIIFRQPKAVNLRSPQRHLTQLQRGQA